MKKWAYYNEIDPFAAEWTRQLMKAGLITDGEVDERSIEDVLPSELAGYTQCHFFAGIGTWSYALRCAGWPDDRVCWTGSCPCQPFSAAGKRGGTSDERHLWPAWHWLIQQCQPDVVFGEQVESKDGRAWLDTVQSDMEASSYAFGPIGICAASFGAPHIRSRLYFVANAVQPGRPERRAESGNGQIAGMREFGELGNAEHGGCEAGQSERAGTGSVMPPGPTNGFWADAEWLYCRDEKYRAAKPGTFPLASGVAARVGRLRGYGNGLCAPVAQGFIEAYLETEEEMTAE